MNVGETIRRFRKQQGQTLEVLARGSGVSRAMLSDVERGQKSPTINILAQIAVGLGTTVSELLQEPSPEAAHIEPAARHPRIIDEKSGVVRTTLSSPLLPRGVELVWYDLPPGLVMRRGPRAVWYAPPRMKASGPFPPNPRGTLEHVAVLKGRVRFSRHAFETDASSTDSAPAEPVDLKVGDSVSYRLFDEVRFENAGSGECRLSLFLDTQQSR